ncbi:Protein of unknown function [Gryllus bimaculatus]|nr:Protein of unknown function [Gryllus bimaculatus]
MNMKSLMMCSLTMRRLKKTGIQRMLLKIVQRRLGKKQPANKRGITFLPRSTQCRAMSAIPCSRGQMPYGPIRQPIRVRHLTLVKCAKSHS